MVPGSKTPSALSESGLKSLATPWLREEIWGFLNCLFVRVGNVLTFEAGQLLFLKILVGYRCFLRAAYWSRCPASLINGYNGGRTVKKTLMGLLGAGCMILFAGAPAMAIDLYGFGSYWDKGDADGKWGYGIGLSLPVLTEHIRLDGRVYFFEDSTLGRDDELTLIPFDLGAQVHLAPDAALNPYALGGVSFIYADADRSDVDSSLGAYLGGGLEWAPFSIIKLYGEVVYRFQELDGGNDGDIDVSGYTGNAGVKIYF